MNKALGDKVRKWLQEPLPIHRHSPNPEACLTPLAQADVERMHTVTLGYIQQLESTVSQVSKALCGKENATLDELLQAVDQMKSRLSQVERERDALVYEARGCSSCAHRECDPDEPPCNACVQDGSEYEWRGVCPENTKENET